jgi:sterol desaturase/sphingolipid hydroxylase (fatty acid hydroxylase superfamily)
MSRFIFFLIPFFIVTFVGEAWVRRKKGVGFDRKDGVLSSAIGVGNLLINFAFKGVQLVIAVWLYERRLVDLGTGVLAYALALVADDFVFYWAHRISHEVRFFWATHEVHHSSEQYTLTTALRQPWTHIPLSIFWMPLPLFGFRPDILIAVHTVSLVYQYGLHTELVGKLGPLEWIMNTPSHHRVHHGSNPRYIDKNHGGIFIVWDRLFGTFQVEDEKPVYGLTKPLESTGLLFVVFHEWIAIVRDVRRARGVRQAARLVFGHPAKLAAERASLDAPRPPSHVSTPPRMSPPTAPLGAA